MSLFCCILLIVEMYNLPPSNPTRSWDVLRSITPPLFEMSCVYFHTFLRSCDTEKSDGGFVFSSWASTTGKENGSVPNQDENHVCAHDMFTDARHFICCVTGGGVFFFLFVFFARILLELSHESEKSNQFNQVCSFLLQSAVQVRDLLHLRPRKMKMWFIDSANPDCHKAKAIKLDEFRNYRFCLFWIICCGSFFILQLAWIMMSSEERRIVTKI